MFLNEIGLYLELLSIIKYMTSIKIGHLWENKDCDALIQTKQDRKFEIQESEEGKKRWESLVLIWYSHCTYKLTEAMIISTKWSLTESSA